MTPISDDMVERALAKWFDGPLVRDPQQMRDDMRSALTAALEGSVAVPDGWKLVPIEPTRDMTMHACGVLPSVEGVFGVAGKLCSDVYKWMLEAAPDAPSITRQDRGGPDNGQV